MQTLWDIIAPVYAVMVGIFVPVAVGYGVKLLADKTGIEIEARHREALQSALRNAALKAISLHGLHKAGSSVALETALDYVRQNAGDAARAFKQSDQDLANLLVPKFEEAVRESAKALASRPAARASKA